MREFQKNQRFRGSAATLRKHENSNTNDLGCLLKQKGLAYSQTDQEYRSDPSGGVRTIEDSKKDPPDGFHETTDFQ